MPRRPSRSGGIGRERGEEVAQHAVEGLGLIEIGRKTMREEQRGPLATDVVVEAGSVDRRRGHR
jgi:hypothetical protein